MGLIFVPILSGFHFQRHLEEYIVPSALFPQFNLLLSFFFLLLSTAIGLRFCCKLFS